MLIVRAQAMVGHGCSNQSLNLPVMYCFIIMDSAVEQHLRSDVSTVLSTAKYSQETCSQARVRLHSKAITLDTSSFRARSLAIH